MKGFGMIGVAVCAMLLGAGCGLLKKNGLTQAQAARVTTTLDAMGRAQRAGVQAQANPEIDDAGSATASPASVDDAQLRIAQRLRSGVCQFDMKRDTGLGFGLEVKGQQCPMELQYSLVVEQVGLNTKLTQSTEFQVKDADLRKLNDVDSLSLKGTREVNQEFTMVGGQPGLKISGKAALKGAVHSQKEGNLPLEIVGSIGGEQSNRTANVHSELVAKIAYPDFTAEFKRTQDFDGNTKTDKYYLNGDEMTQQQFSEYLGRAGVVFSAVLSEFK